MLCATLCRHVDCPSSFSLELCLQLCIHKLPKLTTLCFLAVRVLNFGVEHVCFVGTLAFASFGLHVIKTSWSAFGCCRSCGEPLPFRLGLHQSLAVLCPLVLKRLLGQLGWFSHLRFRVAIVLAAMYIDCIAVPVDLHVQTLVTTPVEHMQHVLATEAKSFNSSDKLRAITPDALLTESSAPKPETACNSLSLSATAARS